MKSKSKGPIIQRRAQVDGTTTDQRLLDTRGPSDWVHTDPWRVVTDAPPPNASVAERCLLTAGVSGSATRPIRARFVIAHRDAVRNGDARLHPY